MPIGYSNLIPINTYNNYRRPYPTNILYNTRYSEYKYPNNYHKDCYYPYSRYKYSYVKYAPRDYKRESYGQYNAPIDTFNYFINPTNQISDAYKPINYLNVPPETGNTNNYGTNAIYPNILPIKSQKNLSNIYNTMESSYYPIIKDYYSLSRNSMINSPQYYDYIKDNKYNCSSISSTEVVYTTSTLVSSETFPCQKTEQKQEKIKFMFPSEIVIRSLGPWSQVGSKGEYRSNGTFSIKYDFSEPLDFSKNPFGKLKIGDNFQQTNTNNSSISVNSKSNYNNNISLVNDDLNIDQLTDVSYNGESCQIKSLPGENVCPSNEVKSTRDMICDSFRKTKRKHYDEQPAYLHSRKTKRRSHMDKYGNNAISINKNLMLHHHRSRHSLKNDFEENYKNGKKRGRTRKSRKRAFISDIGCNDVMKPTTLSSNYITKQYATPNCPGWCSENNELEKEEITTLRGSPLNPPIIPTAVEVPISISSKNHFKSECEQINQLRCVCSIRSVLKELDAIIAGQDESNGLLKSLANYSCSTYRPLKSSYKISADMKPRLISNKHKEMLMDEGAGPKEIVDETMDELMDRGVPNKGIDFYVFPSINIEVPCITTNNIQLSPNTADSTKYTWTHGNSKVITEGRITEDLNHKGYLQINGVTMEDSDNYTCVVNYTSPDTALPTTNSYLHTIMVVSEPILALHVLVHYNAKAKCDQAILEMFELYLPQQIEESVCENDDQIKICNVEIHNPMCHTQIDETNIKRRQKKSIYEIPDKQNRKYRYAGDNIGYTGDNMEISLNYEIDTADIWSLMPSTDNKTHCSPFCQQKVILKVTQYLKEAILDALVYPVESSVGILFVPDKSTFNMKTIIACNGGLRLSQGFCVPCPKGFYSEEGSTKCTKCPPGTYQDNVGAKMCEYCPHPFRAGCFQMWFTPIMGLLLAASSVIMILLCCLIIYCLCPKSGRHCTGVTCLCCMKDPNEEKPKTKFKKAKKSLKKQSVGIGTKQKEESKG